MRSPGDGRGGGGGLSEKLSGGVQPTLKNPYAIIYDQKLHFFKLYLLPDQIFDSLFTGMTVAPNISYEGLC